MVENQYGFKKFARLPRADHSDLVNIAIEIIKDDILPDSEPLMDYHPAWLISSCTKQEYSHRLPPHSRMLTALGSPYLVCRALELPPLVLAPPIPSLDDSSEIYGIPSTQENTSMTFGRHSTLMVDENSVLATRMTSLQEDAGLAVQSDYAVYRLLTDMSMPAVQYRN